MIRRNPNQKYSRVFICSPYRYDYESGTVGYHVKLAAELCKYVIDKGKGMPFAPHLLYPEYGILDDRKEEDRNLGISMSIEWLSACDEVVAWKGFVSEGMERELQHARRLGILISWVGPRDLYPQNQ